jgi:fumarylacetoacetase
MSMPAQDDYWRWKSWVASANDPASGFPLQSLPYCSFLSSQDGNAHLGVGIGSFLLDLSKLGQVGLLHSLNAETQSACAAPQLNSLMRCGPAAWSTLRQLLIKLLKEDASSKHQSKIEPLLIPTKDLQFFKPIVVGNYTDFYASIHHATNVGRLFRPDQPLLPNYKWLPIGYHGRASSLVIGGGIRRPHGQIRLTGQESPAFGPTKQLDYELEVAAYIGTGNSLGEPIPIAKAAQHIFGLSLLNDWSARDIQSWEYQPLGPFLGKSFATSISPWVVPTEALSPFRVPSSIRPSGDPEPLSYLSNAASEDAGGIDLTLEVFLSTARMRETSLAPVRLSEGNLCNLYWTFPQMIAHHTSNGCNLIEGDVIASGTVSGPHPGSEGCLLEITRRGASPIQLPNGETRAFLEDADEIILNGFCEREGFPRVSLGECRGTVLPAHGAS